MRQQLIALLIFLATLNSCGQKKEAVEKANYPEHVGDIEFNKDLDDPNFKVCDQDRVLQYYNFTKGFQYKGEKPKINEHFAELKTSLFKKESGYVTIRFIVNCEGKTGRFRIQQMNNDFEEKSFDKQLVDKLLQLTKALDGWIVGEYNGKIFDYYQYLTFKIEEGRLIEILP